MACPVRGGGWWAVKLDISRLRVHGPGEVILFFLLRRFTTSGVRFTAANESRPLLILKPLGDIFPGVFRGRHLFRGVIKSEIIPRGVDSDSVMFHPGKQHAVRDTLCDPPCIIRQRGQRVALDGGTGQRWGRGRKRAAWSSSWRGR